MATRFLRYGCHRLFLSPRDYDLVQSWWERGIPPRVVWTGLDDAYLRRLRRPLPTRRNPPRTLEFAARQVERAWAAYRELAVGRRSGPAARSFQKIVESRGSTLQLDLEAAVSLANRRGHSDLAAWLDGLRRELDRRPAGDSVFDIEEWLEAQEAECRDLLVRSLGTEQVEDARRRAHRDLAAYATDPNFEEYVRRKMRHTLAEEYPLPRLTLL